MKPSDIGKAYDQITHLWESDDFDRNNGIELHKRAIAFTRNRGKALDVGCGCNGRFIDLLLSEGFTPEGVDVSEKMIQLAKLKHPDVNFYHEDICEWRIEKKYDFITAWDSIWHVPLTEQENVVTKLVESLNSGGVLIFSFGGLDAADEHTDDYMGPEVYYSTLGTNGFANLLDNLNCHQRYLENDQHSESHCCLIVEKR